ncbi:unnamed protein product [Durusdinium trenchii]|uniref:Uncharacterized protein n=1 Tax=Durusdinium trenchii TaxID=1381693 RepID=A0ABP0LJ25_9DINO
MVRSRTEEPLQRHRSSPTAGRVLRVPMLFSPADARRRLSDVFEHLQAIDRYLQTIDGCPGPSCAAEASLFSGLDYVRFDGRFATVEEGLDDVGVTMAPGQWPSPSPSAEPTATLQKLLSPPQEERVLRKISDAGHSGHTVTPKTTPSATGVSAGQRSEASTDHEDTDDTATRGPPRPPVEEGAAEISETTGFKHESWQRDAEPVEQEGGRPETWQRPSEPSPVEEGGRPESWQRPSEPSPVEEGGRWRQAHGTCPPEEGGPKVPGAGTGGFRGPPMKAPPAPFTASAEAAAEPDPPQCKEPPMGATFTTPMALERKAPPCSFEAPKTPTPHAPPPKPMPTAAPPPPAVPNHTSLPQRPPEKAPPEKAPPEKAPPGPRPAPEARASGEAPVRKKAPPSMLTTKAPPAFGGDTTTRSVLQAPPAVGAASAGWTRSPINEATMTSRKAPVPAVPPLAFASGAAPSDAELLGDTGIEVVDV